MNNQWKRGLVSPDNVSVEKYGKLPAGLDGIGVGFIPPMLSTENYDEAYAVPEARARETARLLAAREGIFAGTSTGLNVAAALAIGQQLGPGHTVVTVACDSGMKYIASGLFG